MRVSIVIPAFNEEAFLSRTIRAALAQDYPDFEVVVVNNASTDRTAEVAKAFPVKLVHESRKGLLWARECGRCHASGDIIANMDADCLPTSGWLRTGAGYFQNPRVAAVSGPYDYYDGGWFFRYGSLFTQQTVYWLISRLIQVPGIRQGAMLIGGNNFIRATVLREAGGYNTRILFYGEDTDTAKRVARYGKVIFSNRLIMKTSARRFHAEGILHLEGKYIAYFFRTLLSKENVTRRTPSKLEYRQRSIHRLFRVGVILKGIDGLLEFLAGFALLFASPSSLRTLVHWLTQGELQEDPTDFVATHLVNFFHHLSISTEHFASFYLLTYAVAKIGLVVGLLREKVWCYPAAVTILGAFLCYQMYRLSDTHSIGLGLISLLDWFILVMFGWEYRCLKRGGSHGEVQSKTLPS